MPKLKNAKHERFAIVYARTQNASEAYRKAYGDHLSGPGQSGHELLKRFEVWERVEELQDEATRNIALSKDEMHEVLRDTVLTPIGKIDEMNPLCQEMTISPDGSKKLKMPDKLKALELAAKLQNFLGDRAGDKPHVRLQLIASGATGVAAQLDIG